MSSNFRYQHFVEVSENFGGKFLVVDDALSSHEQQIYPITSVDENCIEFEFQTNRNFYVDLRQTYLALKVKFCKGSWLGNLHSQRSEKGAQRRS